MSKTALDLETDGDGIRHRAKQNRRSTLNENMKANHDREDPDISSKTKPKPSLNPREYAKWLPLLLIAAFIYLYMKSLEGCPHRPVKITVCLKWLKENGAFLVIRTILSAI